MAEIKSINESNKGTGAGGANTNLYGKKFEDKTNNYPKLLEDGYQEHKYDKSNKLNKECYLEKDFLDKKVIFVKQGGLKKFIKEKHNIELYRCPDEAYIIYYTNGRKVIKILEKKEQNVEGSVETKLWAAIGLKEEYIIELGTEFEVYYGFCLNNFLKKKIISKENKYITLNKIFIKYDIHVMFGDDADYYSKLNEWIYK